MFILDTNFLSEMRRANKADPKVLAWAAANNFNDFFLSSITVFELELGTLLMERRDAKQGLVLRAWLNGWVLVEFRERILAVDSAVAQCCAHLHVPNPQAERDSFIAATAIVHGMTLVTRNVADFQSTGVSIFNPWNE
ncbi:type II toxin-antitoxin system VapC family toxin [Candidatus Phyllobacterium onerii]|uniref:type II toxin-antitoxin system VapC family toxin n=1 Tax=Candidatus Phyllobacterium onerii TaxID=3020828 RepID=UPI0023310A06|nr:type II toxin-antitoxin system VapC family toxin [Phyllobacterium sp. IY22]